MLVANVCSGKFPLLLLEVPAIDRARLSCKRHSGRRAHDASEDFKADISMSLQTIALTTGDESDTGELNHATMAVIATRARLLDSDPRVRVGLLLINKTRRVPSPESLLVAISALGPELGLRPLAALSFTLSSTSNRQASAVPPDPSQQYWKGRRGRGFDVTATLLHWTRGFSL